MNLQECINDPLFRKEFVLFEVRGLDEIIAGNSNAIEHNKAKISILSEIRSKMSLTTSELDVSKEHLDALVQINNETEITNNRLQILIDLYKKYSDSFKSNLKLSQ